DGFYFGAAYTSADTVDGGAGSLDQIGLQGNYGSTTLGAMTGVEQLVLLAGSDTRFGDPGTNFYDYVLVATDATLAAGQQLVVQANALRGGEDLTFDGSAETDGSFLIYGGSGVDTLTGGAGDDGFFFGEGRWGASDVVNGGTGTMDQLGLQGNFNITFGAGQLIGLEFVVLMSAVDTRFGQGGGTADYSLTMNNANVAAGQTLVVSANTLQTGESLSFNGSAETDGRFDIFSGDGNDVLTGGSGADVIYGGGRGDTLTGGAGNDIFAYRSVTDSNSTERDGIQDFNAGDRIDLSLIDANINAGGNQDFTFVGANAFSGTAGELRYENISLGGPIWLVQGDVNGDGVSDLEIVLVISPADPITAADFIGVNPAFAPVVGGKKYEGSQVMPAEAGATAPDESRPTEPFTRPHDDRSLTLGQDGFLSFGPADGDDDFLVLAGDFADQPLVLPGQPDGLHSDLEAFEGGRGPEFPSSGDVALTLADDSQAFSDNWMDVSGLYNWC
ncbi:MAG: calcium-binding protein, partial [Brevundimonas sp.]